ncbi:hypothetical protein [Halodesulfurarchaeum sp.]|uniref:hypothetical protein n=1 Tax=Halodesulfurarchaeum sp. TaxID=1980530 RepID=UPI002FC29FFD
MTDVRQAFFFASVVLLVFLAFSIPTIEPGSPTFVITIISGVMLLVTLVGSATLIYVDWDPFEKLLSDRD